MAAIRFIFLALAAAAAMAVQVSAQTIVRKKDAPEHEEATEKVVICPSVISAASTAVCSTTYSYLRVNGALV